MLVSFRWSFVTRICLFFPVIFVCVWLCEFGGYNQCNQLPSGCNRTTYLGICKGLQNCSTLLMQCKQKQNKWSSTHSIKMYASANIAFTHLYSWMALPCKYESMNSNYSIIVRRLLLKMTLTSDLVNLFSSAQSHRKYLWQVSSKCVQ